MSTSTPTPGGATSDCINIVAPEMARELFEQLRNCGVVGEPRAAMIERLQLIFERATPGPWHTYQNGVHPVHVGHGNTPDGSGYAICTHGHRSYQNADWIAAIHNDWPMLVELLIEFCAAASRTDRLALLGCSAALPPHNPTEGLRK